MVCDLCAAWVQPTVDTAAQTVRCPECGHIAPWRMLPLFVVTGASGTGKTAVIPELRRRLPVWDVFETDILWDSGGDWQMVKCNWLRIAHHLAAVERPVILCGAMSPEDLDRCESRPYFPAIHYLALYCDETALIERLRARPAWRGCNEAFIAGQVVYNLWLRDNATAAFDPPLTLVDTIGTIAEAAERIARWAVALWDARPRVP